MSEPPNGPERAGPDRPVADRLKALLDRAGSEDEGVLAQRLDVVVAELAALRAVVEGGESRQRVADEVATLAAQVRSDGAEAQTSLAALVGTVQTVAEETPAVRESVAAVSEEVGRVRGRLDAVDAIADRLRALHEHVDGVPRDVADLRRSLGELDLSPVTESVDALRSQLDDVVAQLQGAEAADGRGTADALEGVVRGLLGVEETVTRTAAAVVALEDAASAPLEALRPSLEQIEATVADLPLRLDGLREPDALPWLTEVLDEGARARAGAAEEAESVRQRLDALDSRVDELAVALRSREVPDADTVADLVAERVRPLVAEEVQRVVAVQVPDLLSGAERRLAGHVDDAVMVLAEALLRRRVPAALAAPVDADATARTATAVPADASHDAPEPDVTADQAQTGELPAVSAEPAPEGSDDDAGHEIEDGEEPDGEGGSRRQRRAWRRGG